MVYTLTPLIEHSIKLARTLAMNTLITIEISYLFFIRDICGTSLISKVVGVTG